ncbi:MAG: hypothetical protein NC388_03090 [Clostridium sp.]|nr:hypothetical protein [Clostridium sp.]
MKKRYIGMGMLAFGVMLCCACRSHQTEVKNLPKPEGRRMSIGGKRDAHGCLGSAGYQWSELRKDCIRLFESGVRLTDSRNADAVLATYVVFASDSSAVEVYTTTDLQPLLLTRSGGEWKNGVNVLRRSAEGRLQLWQNGVQTFGE